MTLNVSTATKTVYMYML